MRHRSLHFGEGVQRIPFALDGGSGNHTTHLDVHTEQIVRNVFGEVWWQRLIIHATPCVKEKLVVSRRKSSAVGLDPEMIGGHSPRRGFATTAGDVGADLRLTAGHMRHAKLETTLGYMEDGDRFLKNAGKGFI